MRIGRNQRRKALKSFRDDVQSIGMLVGTGVGEFLPKPRQKGVVTQSRRTTKYCVKKQTRSETPDMSPGFSALAR